ncbi:MAG: hypothetical protein WDN46_16800 [Methylocella sp.]
MNFCPARSSRRSGLQDPTSIARFSSRQRSGFTDSADRNGWAPPNPSKHKSATAFMESHCKTVLLGLAPRCETTGYQHPQKGPARGAPHYYAPFDGHGSLEGELKRYDLLLDRRRCSLAHRASGDAECVQQSFGWRLAIRNVALRFRWMDLKQKDH